MSAVRGALVEALERAQTILSHNRSLLPELTQAVDDAVFARQEVEAKIAAYTESVDELTEAIAALPAEEARIDIESPRTRIDIASPRTRIDTEWLSKAIAGTDQSGGES